MVQEVRNRSPTFEDRGRMLESSHGGLKRRVGPRTILVDGVVHLDYSL